MDLSPGQPKALGVLVVIYSTTDIVTQNGSSLVVKWSVCSPSTLKIQVRILLTPTVFR